MWHLGSFHSLFLQLPEPIKTNDATEGPGSAHRGFCHMDRGTLSSVIRGYNSPKRKMCKLALVPHAVVAQSSFLAFKEKINKSP